MHAREVEFWIGASLGDYYKLKVLREANIKRGEEVHVCKRYRHML